MRARAEYRKAIGHLQDAEILAKRGDTPNPCAHAAYYAMYHAACAVLLITGGVDKRGDLPDNHRDIVLHYGGRVAKEATPMAESGAILNNALNDRMIADYVLDSAVPDSAAKDLTKKARQFVDGIAQRWERLTKT